MSSTDSTDQKCLRRSRRQAKTVKKFVGEVNLRQRGTGRCIKRKRSKKRSHKRSHRKKVSNNKRSHRHGNTLSERQVRQEVSKRIKPLISATLKAQDKANHASQISYKLRKKLVARDSKLQSATQRIVTLSERV